VSFFLILVVVSWSDPSVALERTADWTLETTTGETVNFHETLGKGPVVLNFWATWCRPCLKEMPHMNRLAGEYAGRVTFLAVNTDASKAVAKVAPFIQAKGYDNLIVPLDTGAELQQLLQVGGILPFTIVFDGQGREIYRHIGYKEGDEEELQREIEALLANIDQGVEVDTGKPEWGEAVTATDRFEYSYSDETRREIFENWLDVSYQFGGFRTGIMLNTQAPSEEGGRGTNIEHRFFEFNSSNVFVRAGHFYGLFGRGLVFNSYEDRTVRIDTRLDGLIGTYKSGKITATAFSGTPRVNDKDIRAADFNYALPYKINLAITGMTYRRDNEVLEDDKVNRDWITAARVRQNFGFGDYYFEYGAKNDFTFDAANDLHGKALYGNLNFYQGPFSVSWETSDYDRFELIPRADGITALNRPPALAREFTWTLMNRAPHVLNANDEVGNNLDLMYSGDNGWSLLASGARIRNHAAETIYELAYGSFVKDRLGDFRLSGAYGYQDSEGLRQTAMGELTWFSTSTQSWTLQAEHQHVRLGGGHGFDLGAYDEQWFKLEYETAPRWAFAAILEVNNKYDAQRQPGEEEGPFPAGQITYTISHGGNLNLWAGKRQAGFLCSGGICKFEPAFQGVEVFGVFRY
ncbi:MAG: TlpA family protein disulfide reductase, partial [Candidatus Krumholzibacteria bacterium]|nr:TlpA family protein disulfide reductase [Candidatus Krumholzibacteria bacterium]